MHGNNEILWIHDDRQVSATFWGTGEPSDGNGDCVVLMTGTANYLAMHNCQTPLLSLCKV